MGNVGQTPACFSALVVSVCGLKISRSRFFFFQAEDGIRDGLSDWSSDVCSSDLIYAMSEGNPRLLAGLLSELLDVERTAMVNTFPLVRPEVQSRVLHSASQRMLTGIRTYPLERGANHRSLSSVVEKLGRFLHSELVTRDFNADPVGSFFVDEDVSQNVVVVLSLGLLIGAFVHVRSGDGDIPPSITGSRLRLSYMLAPTYRLLFRNYRDMRLSTALRISTATQQLMFRPEED